jgi:hypothetical protein
VAEVTHASKDHGHACFVGGGDNLFIAHRPPRLDDAADTRLSGVIDTVTEGEEGV